MGGHTRRARPEAQKNYIVPRHNAVLPHNDHTATLLISAPPCGRLEQPNNLFRSKGRLLLCIMRFRGQGAGQYLAPGNRICAPRIRHFADLLHWLYPDDQ